MNRKNARNSIGSVAIVAALLLIYYFGALDQGKSTELFVNPDTSPNSSTGDTVDLTCVGCNLILLNIELLRADYVGLINPVQGVTPHIDDFFSNGILFSDLSSGSGATYLSATATATGTETMLNEHRLWKIRRPTGGGIRIPYILHQDGKMLIDYFPTIAQVLLKGGYRTTSINQWIHSGKRAFLDRGFSDYVELPEKENQLLFEKQIDVVIDSLVKREPGSFYFYFHPNSLHIAFHYPLRRAIADTEFMKSMKSMSYVKGESLIINSRNPKPPHPSPSLIWKAYEQQVRYVDEQLARLFVFLEEKDLLQTTIVVLYANHGLGVNKEGKLGVGLSYQSYLHVPLLIRHPNVGHQIRIEAMASLVDLAPTLYKMLGVKIDHNLTTYSLAPLITRGNYEREYAYSKDIQNESVRKGDWKLIVIGGQTEELYNLKTDPQEQNNVYEDHKDIARKLTVALEQKRIQQLEYTREMKVYFDAAN